MASQQKRKEYLPPVQGLNSRFLPSTIGEKESSVLLNAAVNNSGTIEKYPGYTLDGVPFSNCNFIRTIFDFRRGAVVDQLLIAAADNNNTNATYKVDIKSTIGDGTYQYIGHTIGTASFTHSSTAVTGTNTSWTHELKAGDKIKATSDPDSDYTEIAVVNSNTSLTLVAGGYLGTSGGPEPYIARKIWNNNNVPRFATFNGVACITDGNGVPQQWDGTSLNGLINTYAGTVITVQPNAAPTGFAYITHKNRLFTYIGSIIYWSHANDQTFWDPASTEPVFPEDGGDIVALRSFADSIFVFKNNGLIYRVFGDFADSAQGTVAYIAKVDYSENIGVIADRGVCTHGGGAVGNPFSTNAGSASIYFISETGVYEINQYGTIRRISYYIEPTTSTFNFSLGAQTAKNFPFQTKTEWDSGVHSGTYAVQTGQLYSYFDDYRQTDAMQLSRELMAIAIDSSNTIHIAYVTHANAQQLYYVKYYTTGFVPDAGSNPQKEVNILPANAPNSIQALSIDVDPTTGNVGIVYSTVYNAGLVGSGQIEFIERTADVGTVLGTWSAPLAISTGPSNTHAISFKYSSGGVPSVINVFSEPNTTHSALYYAQRNGGVWTTLAAFDDTSPDPGAVYYHASLTIDGSGTIWITTIHTSASLITAFKSTSGGASWTTIESFVPTNPISTASTLQGFLDHNSNFYSVFSDTTGTIIRRNHTLTTSLTVDSSAGSISLGGLCISRTVSAVTTDYFYYLNYIGTTSKNEKYLFETSDTLTNPTANTLAAGINYRTNDNSLVNNGQVIATVQPGNNANELVIRRMSLYGFWTGPEQHDSTLTAWGTFATSQPSYTDNLTYQIALASSPGATNFNNIASGATISSNSALIYNVPKIIFTDSSWNGIQVNSIILNYTGAGVDSRQAFAISFYNEAFFAVSTAGQTTNNEVLVYDAGNAAGIAGYSVNCMERFKTLLYAGSATDGSLLVLKNGYSYNGSSYSMDVQLPEDFLENPELQKDFFKFYVIYAAQSMGTFTVSYRLDNYLTPGGSTWIPVVIDQTNGNDGIVDHQITNNAKGRSIQFRIQNTAAGQQVNVHKIVLVYGLRDLR